MTLPSGLPLDSVRKMRIRALGFAAAAATLAAIPLALPVAPVTAEAAGTPTDATGLPGVRRLNQVQYERSIEQIFGPGIKVPGRFDPPLREQGLLAIGDGRVTVTASGIEQYELRAREIAAQAMAPDRAAKTVPCPLPAAGGYDRDCAAKFITQYGRLLYRRPLSEAETTATLAIVERAARENASFAKGLEVGLSRLLLSPNFIFRVERSVPDPTRPSGLRLDDFSLATRISFLLWDGPPDAELLDAAQRGELRDPAGLERQVDRLIASPHFEQGVRSFFSDMLGYDQFQGLAKDQAIYPKFTSDLAKDAQEQALRTIVDLLVTNRGDYRDLFTTRKTFMTRALGALYKVPVSGEGVEGWTSYTFPEGGNRGGLLSLAGFLMLDPTHEGRSSPTIRGKSIRELLLCQPVPQPPPNVNFNLVQDTTNPLYKTARQRLVAHQENPACAGCHALTDPIGLSLENYDAVGNFRTHENGAPIDVSGTFEGKPYTGLVGISRLLRDSPEVSSCAVQRVYEYAVGREAGGQDSAWLAKMVEQFGADGYRLPALMRRIATSDALGAVGALPLAKPALSGADTQPKRRL